MILANLIRKEDLAAKLQDRYDASNLAYKEAEKNDTPYTSTHYHAIMVACVRIAEDFGIDLKRE